MVENSVNLERLHDRGRQETSTAAHSTCLSGLPLCHAGGQDADAGAGVALRLLWVPSDDGAKMISQRRFPYTITPKVTAYRGMTFDSITEARYAVLFDHIGYRWKHHGFGVRCGKYNPIEPDFIVDRNRFYSSGRKFNRLYIDSDVIVEIKPDFVTVNTIRHAIESDSGPFQITALAQCAAEGWEVVICNGALFDTDNRMESVDDLFRALRQDFIGINDMSAAHPIITRCGLLPEQVLTMVIAARRFKFHLQTEFLRKG